MKSLPMKLLSIFLVLVLLVNMLPMGVFAQEVREDILSTENQAEQAEDAEETSEASDPEIVAELADQRTEFSKTFRMDNGLTMAVIYPDPIHYEKEGEWADIDNTLVAADNGSYTNTDGVWDVSFPEQLDGGNSVVIEKDGYTLSFSMAGQLMSQFSTARTSTMTAQLARASEAQIQQKESAEIKTAEQALEKLQSRVSYNDVYENTDIVYDLESSKVKESVILESYNSALQGYRYILNVGEMTPVVEEDGQISFYDPTGENLIMVMPAPFLVDDANVHNYDVEVNLSGSGSRYILTYLLPQQWLAAEDRAWPVVLDPIVTGEAKASTIDDRTVCANKTYGKAETFLLCGYYGNWGGAHRTYLKYDDDALPQLNGSKTVVRAELGLFEYNSNLHSYNTTVEVHKVTESWTSSSITWNTQPAYDSRVEDYCVVGKNGDGEAAGDYAKGFFWNITGTVRDWYSGTNNGVMLKATDAAEASKVDNWTYLRSSDSDGKPVLYIYFRHNSGIESYYTYQTLSAGNAGTAYICDSTGQLKVQKNIASYASTVNSFSLNLVYNSDYFAQNSSASDGIKGIHGIDMLFGNGFTLDIIQSVKVADLPNAACDYLVWHDGDGTDHYFEKQDDGSYKDEDGLNLTISVSGSDYTMKNDQGYTWFFDDGLLSEMTDETGNKIIIKWEGSGNNRYFYNIVQKNKYGSEITVAKITYKSGTSYIASLTDAAGRKYTFTYDNSNNLTAIYLTGTQIARYDYLKVNNVPKNRLVGMQDMESRYWLWFEYSGGKVKTYQEWTDSVTYGAKVEVTYSDEMTTYRDYGTDRDRNTSDDILTNYVFDYWGRTVNAYSTDNYQKILGASNASYTGSGKDTENPKKNNRVENTAAIGVPAQNMLKNHGFESGTTGWTLSSTSNFSASTYSRHTGEKALECWMGEDFSGSSIFAFTSAQLYAGTTYTFSAYVNTSWVSRFESNGYVHLLITNNAGDATWSQLLNYNTSGTANGWTRLSATITPKATGNYNLMVQGINLTGWFYVDDFQLEIAEAPSNHNLIENGNLTISEYGWLMQQGGSYLTTENGNKVLQCIGSPAKEACAWQNVPIRLPGTETYVLSGWAWADSVPDNDNAQTNENYAGDTTKSFGLRATVRYTDGTQEHHYVPFSPDVKQWQFASLTIVPKEPTKTVNYIQVVCAYEKNANSVWFDEISLVREAAQSMRYDENGNLVSVTTTGMDEQTATYDNGNLLEAYTGGSGKYTYEYDETYKHRVTSATEDALKQKYTYDGYGNVTGTTLTKKDGTGTALTTSSVYQDYGNRVYSVTDANGNTVWNYYDTALSKMTGAPTKISTALPGKGIEDTSTVWLDTETAYDNFGRTDSVTVKEKKNYQTVANPATLDYTYSKGNLTNIQRTASGASQNYVLGYDVWGNNTSISVGDLELASYTYADENGNLESMTYGNGDKVSYTYDKLGRVETVTYYTKSANAVTRVLTYTYNGEGQVHSVHDSATGETLRCVYDSLGRVISADNGDVRETYTYNSYNQLTKYRFVSPVLGDGTQTYTYDTNSANSRSDGMLTGMTMVSGHTAAYSYDALQRLTQRHINSGKTGGGMWDCYTYKGGSESNTTTTQIHSKQNWLNNSIKSNFLFFEYDGVGNITKETRHTYNIPEDSDTSQPSNSYTVSTVHYTYDNLNQLTKVTHSDGTEENYAYDNAGNITTFNNGSTQNHSLVYEDTNGWKDLLTAVDGNAITYDTIGNPLSYYNGYTFNWTEGRKLQSVSTGENQTTSYTYDANGLRIRKTNPDGSYIYYHVLNGRYLGETHYNALNQRVKYLRYTYDENDTICGIGIWYAGQSHAWEEYYFEKNLQGDVIAVYTAANGENGLPQLVASYTYDAWGNILSATDADGNDARTTPGTVAYINPFRYRGYYYDTETKFYYLQSRYYDPAIGRFVNADKFASTGQGVLGFNMFAYCGNNPVSFTDPAGTSKVALWEKMGFAYDGSMRDFRRLNQGLPPYAYEQWLAKGGTVETDYIERSSNGITVTIESVGYVPTEKTKDYYIEQTKKNQTSNMIDDFSFLAGTATLFIKNCPTLLTAGLYAIDAISYFNSKASQSELRAYEKAMYEGTGVLIIRWSVEGPRCVGNSYSKYYSWNGEGDPFA